MPEMIFFKKPNKYDSKKGKVIDLKFTLEKYEHLWKWKISILSRRLKKIL